MSETTHNTRDGIDTPMVAVLGVISAVLLFGLIVGVQALYLNYAAADSSRKTSDVTFGQEMLIEQENALQQRGWLDRDAGRLAIPIERAMELTVDELRRDRDTSKQPAEKET
jgi:hypothetical protein